MRPSDPNPVMRDPARRSGMLLALLAALFLAPACDDGEAVPEDTITQEQFIDAVVALRRAEYAVWGMDSAAVRFEERRDSVLEEMALTEADLERFVAAHQDLGYLESVWDTISQRLRRPLDEAGTGRPHPGRME